MTMRTHGVILALFVLTSGQRSQSQPYDLSADGIDSQSTNTSELIDEGSGDIDFIPFYSPGPAQATSLPHLVVNDTLGHPCLLATLNATMQVSYRVPEVIVHETYIAFADIQLPEDVHAQGLCSENVSRLLLDWGNKTFQVNLTFTRKDPDGKSKNSTWSLAAIAISYDLSNTDVFKASTTGEIVTVERQHLSLFTTQVGNTYKCDSNVRVQVGSNERGVSVTFHDVRLAAFGVTSTDYPTGVELCSAADHASRQDEILVPLIVACCLSLVVVIIVIAYVISRKVQEAREQSDYKQMP